MLTTLGLLLVLTGAFGLGVLFVRSYDDWKAERRQLIREEAARAAE